MIHSQVQLLHQTLEGLKQRLTASDSGDGHKFLEAMGEFWRHISSIEDESVVKKFEESEGYQAQRAFFAPRWSRYLRVMEEMQSAAMLGSVTQYGFSAHNSVLAREDYRGIEAELSCVVDAQGGHRLVMVGCGQYPETLIQICASGLRIEDAVGIDCQQDAAVTSQRVLEKWRPSQTAVPAQIECADGATFDFSRANLVLMANGTARKQAILQRIVDTAPADVRILARNPILLGRMLYEDIFQPALNKRLILCSENQPSKLSRTYLFKKQG